MVVVRTRLFDLTTADRGSLVHGTAQKYLKTLPTRFTNGTLLTFTVYMTKQVE